MIIILIPPIIAEIVIFSLNPNRTTSFSCKNLYQVHVSKVFTLPAIYIS